MISYQQGETVIEECFLYNENNLPIDADTVVITVKDITNTIAEDSAGLITDEIAFIHDGLGENHYNFDLPGDALIGLWKIIVKATLDGVDKIRNDSFRVIL